MRPARDFLFIQLSNTRVDVRPRNSDGTKWTARRGHFRLRPGRLNCYGNDYSTLSIFRQCFFDGYKKSAESVSAESNGEIPLSLPDRCDMMTLSLRKKGNRCHAAAGTMEKI